MNVNEHIVRITGTANIPQGLELDYNYTLGLNADVVNVSDKSNQDGSVDRKYNLKLTGEVTIVDAKGHKIITKDKRSMSKKLRGAIWHRYQDDDKGMTEEDFYQRAMGVIISNFDLFWEYIERKLDE